MSTGTQHRPVRTVEGIRKIFADAAGTYELTNRVLTMGLDVHWRRRAVARAVAGAKPGRWLDVCTGTGETAILLKRRAGPGTEVAAADFCKPMLARAAAKPGAQGIRFVTADARDLPFESNSLDLVTISFALRNINIDRSAFLQCLREIHRILKPGGCFVSVETTQPPSRLAQAIMRLYVRLAVRRIGQALSGSRAAYAYLAHTIPRFYGAAELAAVMREAGFSKVTFRYMGLGIVAVHQCLK